MKSSIGVSPYQDCSRHKDLNPPVYYFLRSKIYRQVTQPQIRIPRPTLWGGSLQCTWWDSTPTKRQVSKCQVSKRPVSKRMKRQVYKTSGLQNVRFTKRQVYKTSGLQKARLQKNIHLYSVLVVGGNPQVLLQPCLQAK
jgi:hypothetical protein